MNKIHSYKTARDLALELLQNKAEEIRWSIHEDNQRIAPASATITLLRPDRSNFPEPVSAAPMTVLPSGEVSYTMPAANTGRLLERCLGTLDYTHSGEAHRFGFLFDIVRSRLEMTITDEDLFSEFPALRDATYRLISTASDAGTATTLRDAAQLIQPDGYWTGGVIEFPEPGAARHVTGYSQAAVTLTFTPPLPAATAPGMKYVVSRSFARERLRAFQDILERLRNSGRRAALVMDSRQLRAAHIFLTLAKIFRGFTHSDMYQALARDYTEMHNRQFQELRLDYDANEDARVDRDEGNTRFAGFIGRA